MLRLTSTVLIAWLLIPASAVSAQNDRSRLIGLVTDVSGGALPGATVTISGAAIRPASIVTDGSGRYITPWVAPGSYDVTFALSGFETRTVTGISLGTGQTVVLDQQLPIGSFGETVEVKARHRRRPRPHPSGLSAAATTGQAGRQGNPRLRLRSATVAGFHPRDRARRLASR
jgi:hypothetical protein